MVLCFSPEFGGSPCYLKLRKEDVVFDHKQFELVIRDKRIQVTPVEWALARLLHSHFGDIVATEAIEHNLYDMCDEARGYDALRSVISRFRVRLVDTGIVIRTRYGFGYGMEAT